MQRHTKTIFVHYYAQLLFYKKTFYGAVGAVSTGVIAGLVSPMYYKDFFDTLGIAKDPVQHAEMLHNLVFSILAIHLVGWVAWRLADFFCAYFQTEGMKRLMAESFEHIHGHGSAFFNNTFVGALTKKVNRFSDAFEVLTDIFLWEFLPLFIEVLFVTTYLFFARPVLGAIICVWLVVYFFCNIIFLRYKKKFDEKHASLDSKATGVLTDSFTNHQNIRLFSALHREKKQYKFVQDQVFSLRRWRWNLDTFFTGFQYLLVIGVECLVFYFGTNMWSVGGMSIGDFALIQAYLLKVFGKMNFFSRTMQRWYASLANAKEMADILNTPHVMVDKDSAPALSNVSGKVSFECVSFGYGTQETVLDGFNLTIEAGQKVGLVGPSGSGKTTLLKLLLRLFDPTTGVTKIDDIDITSVTQDSLHDVISFVPQDPILFNKSIIDNIRYGKPDATLEEVVAATKATGCHEFIVALERGYDALVGERGVKLSGGQRQRIAIARAVLRDAPILLLDEATSALDSESEMLIQRALNTVRLQGKTVIAIAHRLSSVSGMDRVIVMDRGNIVEDGTHINLLDNVTGLYSKLWNMQVQGFVRQQG